jgi:hypothetical protein
MILITIITEWKLIVMYYLRRPRIITNIQIMEVVNPSIQTIVEEVVAAMGVIRITKIAHRHRPEVSMGAQEIIRSKRRRGFPTQLLVISQIVIGTTTSVGNNAYQVG